MKIPTIPFLLVALSTIAPVDAAIVAITAATGPTPSNGTTSADLFDGVLATSTATFGTGSPVALSEANKTALVSNNAYSFDGGGAATWAGQYLSNNNNGTQYNFTVATDSTIGQVLVWNYSQNALRGLDAITSIQISTDDGATYSTNVLLSQWTLLAAGDVNFAAQIFDLPEAYTGVDRIRFTVAQGDTGSGETAGGFDEVAFSSVPEPSVALLGGLGLLALVRRRR